MTVAAGIMTMAADMTGAMMRVAVTENSTRSEEGVMILIIKKSLFSCSKVLHCNSRICAKDRGGFFVRCCK